MSKMGISTLASYTGAQLFQAIGVSHEGVLERILHRAGTAPPAASTSTTSRPTCDPPRHWPILDRPDERAHRELEVGGEYQWRREGEYHLFNPDTVFKLCSTPPAPASTRIFKEYTKLWSTTRASSWPRCAACSSSALVTRPRSRPPVPIDEVEPASRDRQALLHGRDESYGSISAEAHETLAIAMNRLGGRSNSGEGRRGASARFDPRCQRRLAAQRRQAGRVGHVRCDQRIT